MIIRNIKAKQEINPESLASKILSGDRVALSQGITLVESENHLDQIKAGVLLEKILPHIGQSIRIGITGVPGVGKSTFIEKFGSFLCAEGLKVAVLAVDPSSSISHGSILGDKTRMEQLANHPKAYIRPSASKGTLGGIAMKTRESIFLCESAGFDVVIIETVGVGQSETAVANLCDFFLLLMLAGAGDELQGIKKGIMEMADALVITKADQGNEDLAIRAAKNYRNALHLFPLKENHWEPKVAITSANENRGIENTWQIIQKFSKHVRENGCFEANRKVQAEYWFKDAFNESVLNLLQSNSTFQAQYEEALQNVRELKKSPSSEVKRLISQFVNFS